MSAKGFLSRLAIGTEASFGTATTVSQLLPFTSESLSLEKDKLDDPVLTGTSARLLAETVRQRVSGSIETNLTFGGAFDQIFKAALGSQTSDTTALTETFDLTEDITTSLTIAVDKQVSIHEFSGCKINQLTISSDGSVLTVSVDVLGKSRTINGVNTVTEFDTANGYGTRIRHPDIVFKINGVSVNIASFTLTLNNNLTFIEENALEPIDIERNGKREVSLSFELARYTTDTYLQNFENDTEFSVEISASRGTDSLTITLPKVVVTNVSQPVGGAEIIKQSIECICLASSTANEMQIVRAY